MQGQAPWSGFREIELGFHRAQGGKQVIGCEVLETVADQVGATGPGPPHSRGVLRRQSL